MALAYFGRDGAVLNTCRWADGLCRGGPVRPGSMVPNMEMTTFDPRLPLAFDYLWHDYLCPQLPLGVIPSESLASIDFEQF